MEEAETPPERQPLLLENYCPHCGFSGLHAKAVKFRKSIVVYYHCAVCEHKFETAYERKTP